MNEPFNNGSRLYSFLKTTDSSNLIIIETSSRFHSERGVYSFLLTKTLPMLIVVFWLGASGRLLCLNQDNKCFKKSLSVCSIAVLQ